MGPAVQPGRHGERARSGPVDYTGLPLTDEGRARALSFNYSALSLPEHQCGYLSPFYIVAGPFGLIIDRVLDPVTAKLVAWKIGG